MVEERMKEVTICHVILLLLIDMRGGHLLVRGIQTWEVNHGRASFHQEISIMAMVITREKTDSIQSKDIIQHLLYIHGAEYQVVIEVRDVFGEDVHETPSGLKGPL